MSYGLTPEQEDDEMKTRTKLDAVEDARRRLEYITERLDELYDVDWDTITEEVVIDRAKESEYLEKRKRALVGWLAEQAGGGDDG